MEPKRALRELGITANAVAKLCQNWSDIFAHNSQPEMRNTTQTGYFKTSIRGVSGHNGEQWSAIAGGLGRLLELGDTISAGEAHAAIEAEIDREQAVFDEVAAEHGAELDVLRLSMTLAHNRGDLTQGMGFWKRTPLILPVMEHLSTRGRSALAVRVYQHTGLSAE